MRTCPDPRTGVLVHSILSLFCAEIKPSVLMVRLNNPFKVNGMAFRGGGLNFRIPSHDCVTLKELCHEIQQN